MDWILFIEIMAAVLAVSIIAVVCAACFLADIFSASVGSAIGSKPDQERSKGAP